MMNPEVKVKWLEALRSGEYRQTKGTLRRPGDRFCCLGVLSDLYTKEVEGSWEWYRDDCSVYGMVNGSYGMVNGSGSDVAIVDLLPCIRDWAGLEGRNPEVHVAKGECDFVPTTLAELNDEGMTFKEIADIIDHQL